MRILAITLASALMLATSLFSAAVETAHAESVQCGHRSLIVQQLASKHKEQQAVMGLSSDGRLVEIWSSYQSRSFTVLLTWPTMQNCIVAAGEGLEMKLPGEFISQFEF